MHLSLRSLGALARPWAYLLAAGSLGAGLILACGGGDDDAGGPGGSADPEVLFRGLEDDLVTTCGGAGGSCHVQGVQAPRWLADPDPYESAKRYRGILPVTREVGDSILLTQVDHSGPSLKRYPDLYERVAAWIQAEVPPPALPNTGAFSVADGFNVVDLNTVAEGLTGARITFVATQANGVLTLSALKLMAPRDADVKIDSPFFVLLPRSGKVNADPEGNGFKGELTVAAGKTVDLYTGKMILLRWDQAGQLKIVFASVTSTPAPAVATGCTALELFKSSALPAMQSPIDILADDDQPDAGAVIGKGSCVGCHAAAASPDPTPAVQAMDLRGFDADPAAACAQARFWINFADRAQSTLILNPTGTGNMAHPTVPIPTTDPIIQGLRTWIDAEQP